MSIDSNCHRLVLANVAAIAVVLMTSACAAPDASTKAQKATQEESTETPVVESEKSKPAQRGEKVAAHGKRNAFERLDLDGDGIVSEQEYMENAAARFEKLAGGDGASTVSLDQFSQRKTGKSQEALAKSFARKDLDGNGSITAEENAELAKKGFDLMDTNENGKLELEEHLAPRSGRQMQRRSAGEQSDKQTEEPKASEG